MATNEFTITANQVGIAMDGTIFSYYRMPWPNSLFDWMNTGTCDADISSRSVPLIEQDVEYFERNRSELIKRYNGKYIAVLDGQVIGDNPDLSLLANEIYGKYGLREILIRRVEEESEQIGNMPMPRILRELGESQL